MLSMLIYFADVFDRVNTILTVGLIIFAFISVVLVVIFFIRSSDTSEVEVVETWNTYGITKVFKTTLLVLVLGKAFIPSSTTVYLMTGVYIGQETVQAISKSTVLSKVHVLIEKKLDDLISEPKQVEQK